MVLPTQWIADSLLNVAHKVRVDDRFVICSTDTLLLSGNKHIFNLNWSVSHVP